MKFRKSEDGGFVHNCIVVRRKEDKAEVLFYGDTKRTTAYLNGYAIIPIEEYAKLKGEKADLTDVKIAEDGLHGRNEINRGN